jgi:hypothetical protein
MLFDGALIALSDMDLALGRIMSVDPVRVDCGIYVEERALFTHDARAIGEFVGFRIERLDAAG